MKRSTLFSQITAVAAMLCAMVRTIPPGQYTAQVRGKGEASGIGVVEVYFLQ